jgi:hypothetical protein
MNNNIEYKQSTQKLIHELIDKTANHTDVKILQTIVKDEDDLVEKEPMNHITLYPDVSSLINME